MKKCKGPCKTGKTKVPPAKAKAAVKHWESKQGIRAATFVGSLPPPPEGIMAMYCMNKWYAAYATAARMDELAAVLPGQIQAYSVCVAQHTV